MSDVCGNCRHWHRQTPDPAQQRGAVVLPPPDAPAVGNCRARPPQMWTLVGIDPRTGALMNQTQVGYPPLPAAHPVCGLFTPRDDGGPPAALPEPADDVGATITVAR